ncbi:organic cation transporter protein [Diabrotica virgifera virgifera]|uniref:Major facilitator superfamily (MFS) profile domain-containing protein n=1 Tax=Diabrotica virgifera virgifera TaxID=50390 RepID=A0ABM5KZH3_DIAVI|nr:organic cation transporter protein [Diabrotica virgifera virgifera]
MSPKQDEKADSRAYSNDGYVSDSNEKSNAKTNGKNNHSIDFLKKGVPKELESGNDSVVEKGEPFEFDDLLPYLGEFGRYQKILFLLMIPFAFFVAFVYFTQIFITILPEKYWCRIPALANLTVEERLALAIPEGHGGYDRCRMYDVNFTEVLRSGVKEADPRWNTVACKYGWEYDFSVVPYASISSELNWVCENSALPTTAQAIFFCGAILGGLVFGWMADRYGRVPALMGCNLVGLLGGVATAFCHSFWAFCVCRFLVGMAFDNCFTMMYILVLEYVGPKWRTFVANMSIAIFFTFAASILPWIAYYLADWRLLCYATSAPLVIAIFTPWLVPESARWLVSQGQTKKAIDILKRFEKVNKTHISEKIYEQFRISCEKAQQAENMERKYTVIDLFKTPRLRKITLILVVLWMAISLVFDGHVRNVETLGLNTFLTFTIASATEFPADTFLTFVLDIWGRRWLAAGSMIVSGIFTLFAIAVPLGIPSATLAIMGRFAINISYNIGLQYAAEILPTVVRAQGVALIHIMGYVASIIAPFVVYLANISTSFPLLILGVLGILGGLLALFLPETLDQELPQTLQDGENFGLGQKMWDFPCIKSREAEEPTEEFYRATSATLSRRSTRASFRGEARSSMLNRASIRSRKLSEVPDNKA